MSKLLSMLGKVFVFCTFLPGLTGFILIVFLYPELELEKKSAVVMSGIIYGIGFVGNILGHFVEVLIYSILHRKWTDRFGCNYLVLIKNPKTWGPKSLSFYEYSENILVWYWNSAFTILVISIVRLFVSPSPSLPESDLIIPLRVAVIVLAFIAGLLVCVLRIWFDDEAKSIRAIPQDQAPPVEVNVQ